MLRGLVVFTKEQIAQLVKVVSNDRFKGTTVQIKIVSASHQDLPQIPLEFSEEEVELLVDELATDPNNEIRKILTATVLSWRS